MRQSTSWFNKKNNNWTKKSNANKKNNKPSKTNWNKSRTRSEPIKPSPNVAFQRTAGSMFGRILMGRILSALLENKFRTPRFPAKWQICQIHSTQEMNTQLMCKVGNLFLRILGHLSQYQNLLKKRIWRDEFFSYRELHRAMNKVNTGNPLKSFINKLMEDEHSAPAEKEHIRLLELVIVQTQFFALYMQMYPQHSISHRDHENCLYNMIQQCKPIAHVLEYDNYVRKHYIEKIGEPFLAIPNFASLFGKIVGKNWKQPFLAILNLYQSFREILLEKIWNSNFWPF